MAKPLHPALTDLASYLNEHLGGAATALELLDHLVETHAGTPDEALFVHLRREINEDRDALAGILEKLGAPESKMHQGAGWLAEKFTRLKMRIAGADTGGLGQFEGIEMLALGIEGKRSVWRTLAAIADAVPPLQGVDLAELEKRADEQHALVEARRLAAAREVFARSGNA